MTTNQDELPPGGELIKHPGGGWWVDGPWRRGEAPSTWHREQAIINGWSYWSRKSGITREEWARLQGLDAELAEERADRMETQGVLDELRGLAEGVRVKLTEAEAEIARAEVRLSGWSNERARADKAEADLANAEGTIQCVARGRLHAAARNAALQKRAAELEGELLEARGLAVTAMEIVDHAAAARQALKWLTKPSSQAGEPK